MALAFVAAISFVGAPTRAQGQAWREPLLRADWPAVLAAIPGSPAVADPAWLVRAHALLALGHENEAICSFGAPDLDALQAWQVWVAGFRTAHRGSGVANYLAGDVAARLLDWQGATAALDAAAVSGAVRPLALHARGVVEAATGKWDTAIATLTEAATLAPAIREIAASRASVGVLISDGRPAAQRWYARAQADRHLFGSATIGDAAVSYAAGKWDESRQKLLAAQEMAPCLDQLIQANLVRLALEDEALQLKLLGRARARVAGTTIKSRTDAVQRDSTLGKIDQMITTARDRVSTLEGNISANNLPIDRKGGEYSNAKANINQKFWSDFVGGTLRDATAPLKVFEMGAEWAARNRVPGAVPWAVGLKIAGLGTDAGSRILKDMSQRTGAKIDNYINTCRNCGGVDLDVERAAAVVSPWPIETVFGLRYFVLPPQTREKLVAGGALRQ